MVVQTADVWNCDDRAAGRRLGSPRDGSILVERKMRAPIVVVREIASKVAVQRALVPDDDLIETLAPEGADHPFNKRILPGRSRRYQDFLDAHLLRGTVRIHPVNPITIMDDESRRSVPQPCLSELVARSTPRSDAP